MRFRREKCEKRWFSDKAKKSHTMVRMYPALLSPDGLLYTQ